MHEHIQDDLIFNWNESKAEINERKHGVTFEEAATAFRDINAQIYDDDEHSIDEERFILLGCSVISHLLMVCHCYRGRDDDIIRIISARKADNEERKKYEERGYTMKDHYDLKNPRKNPYAERMKNGYRIIIDRDRVEDDKAALVTVEKTNQNKLTEYNQIVKNY